MEIIGLNVIRVKNKVPKLYRIPEVITEQDILINPSQTKPIYANSSSKYPVFVLLSIVNVFYVVLTAIILYLLVNHTTSPRMDVILYLVGLGMKATMDISQHIMLYLHHEDMAVVLTDLLTMCKSCEQIYLNGNIINSVCFINFETFLLQNFSNIS